MLHTSGRRRGKYDAVKLLFERGANLGIRALAGATLCLGGVLLSRVALGAEPALMPADAQRELLNKYCLECHNYSGLQGRSRARAVRSGSGERGGAEVAEKMLKKLRAGMMPPAGKPRPDFATVRAFATTLEHTDRQPGEAEPAAFRSCIG